jgi:sec-independent protein translocase protein TatA
MHKTEKTAEESRIARSGVGIHLKAKTVAADYVLRHIGCDRGSKILERVLRFSGINHRRNEYIIKMNIFAFGIGNLGGPDLFIILLIVLVLFGAKKLPDLARSLGQSMNEFRKAREEIDRELHNLGAQPPGAVTLPVRAATGKASEPDR